MQHADGLVIVHPNWWGQPPAMMKGWIDRVIRPGVAYKFEEGDGGEGVPVGLLRAQTAIIFNTSNTPPARELEVFGDPLDNLWKRCILDFCGVKECRPRDLQRGHHQHAGAARRVARSGRADCDGNFSTIYPLICKEAVFARAVGAMVISPAFQRGVSAQHSTGVP